MATMADIDALEKAAAGCDFVRFTFSDMHGINRGKTVAAKYLRGFLEEGIGLFSCEYSITCGPPAEGPIGVTALCSEGSMFRRFYVQKIFVQKVLCSEGSIFRRFYVQKVLCSEGPIFRRKVLCLEVPMFRKYLFKRFYI